MSSFAKFLTKYSGEVLGIASALTNVLDGLALNPKATATVKGVIAKLEEASESVAKAAVNEAKAPVVKISKSDIEAAVAKLLPSMLEAALKEKAK